MPSTLDIRGLIPHLARRSTLALFGQMPVLGLLKTSLNSDAGARKGSVHFRAHVR